MTDRTHNRAHTAATFHCARAGAEVLLKNWVLVAALGFGQLALADPAIFFTDVESGPVHGGPHDLGVPISIFGKGFGSARGVSKVTIGGVEVAAYAVWGANNARNNTLDMVVVQPGATTVGGPIVLTVNGTASNSNFSFVVNTGKVRYVATNGADSNPCTELAPCATLLHVIDPSVTGSGDTVLVRGGNYGEGEIWVQMAHKGASGQQKTLKNFPGEEVLLSNPSRNLIVDSDYITISGFHFSNGKSTGVTERSDLDRHLGDKFINNLIDGELAWAAIDSHGNDHTLAGNVCNAATSTVGTQGHCYYVSYGNNLKILYNIANGATGYGLHIFDQRRQTSDFRRVISQVLVEGNILKSSPERSGMILAMGDEGGYGNKIDGVTIRNNIFLANNHVGLALGVNVRNIKVLNNTFYQNGRQEIQLTENGPLSNIVIANNLLFHGPNSNCATFCSWYQDAHLQFTPSQVSNLVVANNGYFGQAITILNGTGSNQVNIGAAGDSSPVVGAVSFLNPAVFDFRVLVGGAAIDHGTNQGGLVPGDYNGVRRPQGTAFDLGAFEYDTGRRDPTGLAAPRKLRLLN